MAAVMAAFSLLALTAYRLLPIKQHRDQPARRDAGRHLNAPSCGAYGAGDLR